MTASCCGACPFVLDPGDAADHWPRGAVAARRDARSLTDPDFHPCDADPLVRLGSRSP